MDGIGPKHYLPILTIELLQQGMLILAIQGSQWSVLANLYKIQTCTCAYISELNKQWRGVVHHVDPN